MWNDIETTQDFLNFKIFANTAAAMIIDAQKQPISIGVSGSWGVGKSSLVKMIGESLNEADVEDKFIFVEFNAWLYQGYDDAKGALLQTVADKLLEIAKEQKTYIDKAKDLIGRINWFRTLTVSLPAITGFSVGGEISGALGGFLGTISGVFNRGELPNSEEFKELQSNYQKIAPDLKRIINPKEETSIPKEIEVLRSLFQQLLESLNITLVVLVDDLDRCLPPTAISTLEAMRLLLFIPSTAFIIAADEQMIRNAVRAHFGAITLNENTITSYFDKLIQIPLKVPNLGVNEIKGYLILLLADLECRRGNITDKEKEEGQKAIAKILEKSWASFLTKRKIIEAYGDAAVKLSSQIDIADQIAPIMVTSEYIAGNPRLVKRFLNNLIIRQRIATMQEMSVSFAELVKMQLFERCAPPNALKFFINAVSCSEDGKLDFLAELEEQAAKDSKINYPDTSWEKPFVIDWLKLSPSFADVDLRPLLYLSRDKTISFVNYDELSVEGKDLLDALCKVTSWNEPIFKRLNSLEEGELDKIFTQLKRITQKTQWEFKNILHVLHVVKVIPRLEAEFIAMLNEIPATKRPAPLIPLLQRLAWADELLEQWANDKNSPLPVRRAITKDGEGK